MAKRTFKKISSFLSFKYFDRRNYNKYREEYKERTGRETVRGWNRSPEYLAYKQSNLGRIKTYAERNPEQFADKKDYVMRHSNRVYDFESEAGDRKLSGYDYLNPMKSSWGPGQIADQLNAKSVGENKELTEVYIVNAPLELGGRQVFSSAADLEQARGEIMKLYGQYIARNPDGSNKAPGTYGIIDADYYVSMLGDSDNLIAVMTADLYLT